VQKLAIRRLIPTDGGQETVISPCGFIRVKMKRQDEQLGWVSPLHALVVKANEHVSGLVSFPVPMGIQGGLRCLSTHPQP